MPMLHCPIPLQGSVEFRLSIAILYCMSVAPCSSYSVDSALAEVVNWVSILAGLLPIDERLRVGLFEPAPFPTAAAASARSARSSSVEMSSFAPLLRWCDGSCFVRSKRSEKGCDFSSGCGFASGIGLQLHCDTCKSEPMQTSRRLGVNSNLTTHEGCRMPCGHFLLLMKNSLPMTNDERPATDCGDEQIGSLTVLIVSRAG
mmetsp:Transcript_19099/g.34674  ORF Transcript_19099/g.34674 Transcript_19099/m.34674 type:complete len:202 (-) Transcript_19099:80-685(-)